MLVDFFAARAVSVATGHHNIIHMLSRCCHVESLPIQDEPGEKIGF